MENPVVIKEIFMQQRESVIREIVKSRKTKNKMSFSEFMHQLADRVDVQEEIEKAQILEERKAEEEPTWEQEFFTDVVFGS